MVLSSLFRHGEFVNFTRTDAFVIRGDNNISDKDVSEGVITIDEVMYGLGCDESEVRVQKTACGH